jgi:hypothetical protein
MAVIVISMAAQETVLVEEAVTTQLLDIVMTA